ncbi:MAG: 3-deoxy-manno-octulosonate cytidylyltransferase [Gemmatimonadetes bacterium]|nr:3-deoxy-manno-octulosonate cytidylyltransferase [Gemmatimonadota bacterium]
MIPARIGSTRLPEKPLRRIAGTPLICRVVHQVAGLGLGGRVVVATDDIRVVNAVAAWGYEATLTDSRHRSGTARVAEVVSRPQYREVDVVLNVQGDEPFLPPEAVRGALGRVVAGDPIGTAAAPLPPEKAGDPHRVKVAVDETGHAVAFSRAPLPAGKGASTAYLQHLGIYAYTRPALFAWVRSQPVAEENVERLEQLRPLKYGTRIGVALLHEEAPAGIDTEDDLANAEAREVNA